MLDYYRKILHPCQAKRRRLFLLTIAGGKNTIII